MSRLEPAADAAAPASAAAVLSTAIATLQQRLPPGWELSVAKGGSPRADALLSVTPPSGRPLRLIVEAKRTLVTRDVDPVLAQLRALTEQHSVDARPMVVARYLAPATRQRLQERGVAYADATGNAHLESARPPLLVHVHTNDRDPWRPPGRPRGTLRGPQAAQVVRAIVDHSEPLPIRRLIDISGVSSGAVYRVVDFLLQEGLVEREKRGPMRVMSWRKLLERWSQDYSFLELVGEARYLFPRGLSALAERISAGGVARYSVTGSLAARQWAPFAPARQAMVYVDDIEAAVVTWGLRQTDTGANVLLARPQASVVYDRTWSLSGMTIAAPSQVAVDLFSGPGRNPSEGEHLLDWMEENERVWRR